jgi:peptidase E
MTRDPRTIVALGGGGFQMTPDDPRLDDHLIGIVRERSGRARPRICLVPTATGDDAEVIASFESLFAARAQTSVLRLFARADDDLRELVLRQDALYSSAATRRTCSRCGDSTGSTRSPARGGRPAS